MPNEIEQEHTKVVRPATPQVTVEPVGVAAQPPRAGEELVLEDLLVEDVSIDGMCGVY